MSDRQAELRAAFEAAKQAELQARFTRAKELEGIGRSESLLRGAGQGASFGFSDEIAGAAKAASSAPADWLFEKLNPDAEQTPSAGERYRAARDAERSRNAAAEEAHPGYYMGGELAGAVLPSVVTGGASTAASGAKAAGSLIPRALAVAAGQGAAQGLGYSNASSVSGLVGDSALGAGLGVGGFGVGYGAGKALQGLARKAGEKTSQAIAKAAAQAEPEKLAEQASRVGKYGGLRQAENKAIRNLLDLERAGIISPENQAALESFRKSGRLAEALNEAAANDIEFLAGRTKEVAVAKKAVEEGKAALPDAIKARTEELSSPKEAKRQVAARLLRYGPPAVGSALGAAIGGPIGVGVGALAGAGTRPMVQALRRMAQHPSVQRSVWSGTKRAAESLVSEDPLVMMLRRNIARASLAPAIDGVATQEEP